MKNALKTFERRIPARVLRGIGFHSESRGLIDRYIQVDGAWDEHLAHTREFITRAVAGRRLNNIVVLGSGWLLDLPIWELAEQADHVWLYDAFQPAQVIHKIRKHRNITAVSADITGGCLLNAWHAVRQYRRNGTKAEPESICRESFRPDVEPDYIISLNLLSQIGIMITGYLVKHVPYTPEEIEKINRLLQQAHLKLLVPGRSCLITDVKETYVDLTGGPAATVENLQLELPDRPRNQTWEWNFDPLGEYKPGKRTVLQVVALEW